MRSNEGHAPEVFFKVVWCGVVQCLNRTPKGMGFVAKNTASTKKAATLSIR